MLVFLLERPGSAKEGSSLIQVQGQRYELLEDFRDGWSEEAFKERYSEVLNKYDYVVGDWGHEQLRMRGFFENDRKKVPHDFKIGTLEDYLLEYCNFGCAYFVLKKVRQEQKEETEEETEESVT